MELKSIDLVAEHFGISQDTAFIWKKRHGIETIKEFSQRGKRKVNHNKPYTNKEWLEEMYSKYSWEELGAMLNCSPTTLSKWGIKFGIKTRTVSEQWDLKTKGGSRVIKPLAFDLQLYKETYNLETITKLQKISRTLLSAYMVNVNVVAMIGFSTCITLTKTTITILPKIMVCCVQTVMP